MHLFAILCDQFGTTREAMQEGLLKVRDVPSVIYGHVTFNPETRRVQGANYKLLLVKNGQFTVWDGAGKAAG
jgi:branched-chain amino acid transport system substrate-binding protein